MPFPWPESPRPFGRRRFGGWPRPGAWGRAGLLLLLATLPVIAGASVQAAVLAALPAVNPAGIITLDERDQYILRYVIYFSVLVGGALGGFIYSVSRHRGFIVPHWVSAPAEGQDIPDAKAARPVRTTYDLGTLADIIVGIGGGIIIFNLVPQSGEADLFESLLNQRASLGTAVSTVMKILALSLIGGFAGISLFDEAAKRINRQLQETQAELRVNRGSIQELQNNDRQESDIQFLLSPLLDPSLQPLTESQNEALKAHVMQAPLNLRNKVFERLQKAHDSHPVSGSDAAALPAAEIETRLSLQEGLLAGFDALIAAARQPKGPDAEEDAFLHRYLAHRGFVHLQLGCGSERLGGSAGHPGRHWREAEESLSQAIELRDRSAADRQMYWHYSLQRMVTRFKLGNTDPIQAELEQPEVKQWLSKSRGIVHAIVKSLPLDFVTFLSGLLPDFFAAEEPTPLQRIQRSGAL
ncbi:hypothetical protein VB738_01700 [Cyanobium gracile UHCC 0139]|uniref:MotA/TolQ/ExbB proton channel domain-containing protein n=1 Tax=Cyanobium gracile UHCC 0139 TaxID=3110308 RepID=A0ABU5RQD0_9CYAN|nr:hypothetical protein [Cyanobium gracile]MEA5389965.1 hypothetical protein [Cyanobium gracile UHCC 0139]